MRLKSKPDKYVIENHLQIIETQLHSLKLIKVRAKHLLKITNLLI